MILSGQINMATVPAKASIFYFLLGEGEGRGNGVSLLGIFDSLWCAQEHRIKLSKLLDMKHLQSLNERH